MKSSSTLLLSGLATLTWAFPVHQETRQFFPFGVQPWVGPGSLDSRGPCPALNTLANHGYIPHDGRQITEQQMFSGFLNAFGMNQSAVAPALPNAYMTCKYLTGVDCASKKTIANLTLLAEPHAAEHDHSLSRQDYRMAYANGGQTDNNAYNATIFQSILDLIGSRTHVDYALANEIRLMRENAALKGDQPGWLAPDASTNPVQAFEMGFIFAVMSDPSLPDYATNPQIRVDWWHYWFANEALPTPLGWQKPNPPRELSWVLAAAGGVFGSKPANTHEPLPSGALDPPGAPPSLPATPNIPILPLPTGKPYSAPGFTFDASTPQRSVAQAANAVGQLFGFGKREEKQD